MRALRAVWRTGSFVMRHVLAMVVTIAVPCVLWTLAYFSLLGWCFLTGSAFGSPLVFPLVLFVILVGGAVVVAAFFFPSTVLAEWLVRHCSLPPLLQVPFCILVFGALCFGFSLLSVVTGPEPSAEAFFTRFGFFFLVHLLPLGGYWWVAQGGPLALSLLARLAARSPAARRLLVRGNA